MALLPFLLSACGPVDPDLGTQQQRLNLANLGGIVVTPPGGWKNAPPSGPSCRTISDAAELAEVLNGDQYRGVICIPNSAVLDLSALHDLPLRDGVTLQSGRGGTTEGALLYSNDLSSDYAMFDVEGSDVVIQGLRIVGPSTTYAQVNFAKGIEVVTATDGVAMARRVVIEDNELTGWPGAAVSVDGDVHVDDPAQVPAGTPRMSWFSSRDVLVTHNYIHDNVRDQRGYGVVVSSGAYATIEGNVFDDNRHAVASDGRPFTGYVAQYNYVLEGGHCADATIGCYWNQHFDVHGRGPDYKGGPGGEYYLIDHNTIRGDQSYYVIKTRPAFSLRGTPAIGAYFMNNVLVHPDQDAAIHTEDGVTHLYASQNQYGTDPSLDWAVGDFDGDGRDDLFIATGTAWFYSSAGQSEWRFLQASTARTADLRFGHFDGDRTTDVFQVIGGNWTYSPSGRGAPIVLQSSSIPISDLRFGDFNHDGQTDVFRADGVHWYVSWSARSPWTQINASSTRIGDLRFGDFDGDGATDVFAIENGWWSWSQSGQSGWMKLNDPLAGDLGSLQFGDFDGDGRTDIAQRDSGRWRYSSGGRGAWTTLRNGAGDLLDTPTMGLVGDFNGDHTDDLVRPDHTLILNSNTPPTVQWGRQLMMWSRPLGDLFQVRSRHYMR